MGQITFAEQTQAATSVSAGNEAVFADSTDSLLKVKRGAGTFSVLDNNGSYRVVHEAAGSIGTGITAQTTVLCGTNSAKSGTTDITTTNFPSFYFDDADYVISPMTLKMRVRFFIQTNATAPGTQTFTGGLYPYTVAGGSSAFVVTLGTVVAGSTVAIVNPSNSSVAGQGNSGDFTIPADGVYALGFTNSATTATNSLTKVSAQLQVRNVAT